MKPLVMITNDDGINSPGLKALAEGLMISCDLLIVAPREQQTNMGRGSLRGVGIGAIECLMLPVNGCLLPAYAINGSPAQAVAHGLLELTDRQPDLCVSGINYGENLGLAFTCSGTLGAAFEADSFGIPAIAFSRQVPLSDQREDDFSILDWEAEKVHVNAIVHQVLTHGLPEQVHILNVNFPKSLSVATEVRVTEQASISLGMYKKPTRTSFTSGYHLEWQLNKGLSEAGPKTDIHAIHVDQVVSITPLNPKMSLLVHSYYK